MEIVTLVVSVTLAAVAIAVSLWAAKESRDNYEKTKDVLSEIDKKASVIERVIADSHKQLLDTVTAKPDMGEQFGAAFISMMMQDPAKARPLVELMKELGEVGQRPNA